MLVMATVAYLNRGAVRQAGWALSRFMRHNQRPRIAWSSASPRSEGLDPQALDRMIDDLASVRTYALLVVRGNRIVREWYAPNTGPNRPLGLAAVAKAVAATVLLMAEVTDRKIRLEDSASRFLPPWKTDSMRSRIRIRDLAFHTSGMEDIDFDQAELGGVSGWRKRYYDQDADRFFLARDTAAILFPPGTTVSYSGMGYYPLAYALTVALAGGPAADVKTYLRNRVMQPVGIPDDQWVLSYGESYPMDGMILYAIGSGADYTPRAAARMGQLLLDHGRWDGTQILDSAVVAATMTEGSRLPLAPGSDPKASPAAGWWLNTRGTWPEIPLDAWMGIGSGHRIILVVPSLDLVVVRLGETMDPDPTKFEQSLRDHLLAPLMRAVVGPSSRGSDRPPAH